MPGFDFITPSSTPWILWILGGLFLFVGTLGGIIIKMGVLMFQWRREIDKEHSENAIAIAKFGSLEKELDRVVRIQEDVMRRISGVRDSRLMERTRIRKMDDMDDD